MEAEDELDLRHYLDVVARRKWVIILATVIATAVAVGLTAQQTPLYRASAEVLLQSDDAEQRLGSGRVGGIDQNQIQTEIGVIESNLVRSVVAEQLGRPPEVHVSAKGETDIIEISATSPEPEAAAAEANTYATTYVEWKRQRLIEDLLAAQQTVQAEIDSLQAQLDELQAPIEELEIELFIAESESRREEIRADIDDVEADLEAERNAIESSLALYQSEISSLKVSQRISRTGGVQIISDASAPDDPFAPQPLRNGVLAVVVGLMLGVGLAFLLETLDDRVRSKEDLERATGWPTIGLVPVIARAKGGQHDLATLEAPNSPAAEAYRTLRTAVQFLGLEGPLGTIQVTSAKSAEGKTTTAANLAITLAQAGRRVILLDGDLRKPRLHHEFDIPNTTGFTSMLLDSSMVGEAFHRTDVKNLVVVPAGPPPPNPSELLSLHATRQVITALRNECDILIIDSPPVLPVTDPLIISGYVDGVILVVDARAARGKELARARELLTQVNANVIGVTVNQATADQGYGYGYGYGYGGEAYVSDEPDTAAANGAHGESGTDTGTGKKRGLFSR